MPYPYRYPPGRETALPCPLAVSLQISRRQCRIPTDILPGRERVLPCPLAVSLQISRWLLNSVNRYLRTYGFGYALKYAGRNYNIFRRK